MKILVLDDNFKTREARMHEYLSLFYGDIDLVNCEDAKEAVGAIIYGDIDLVCLSGPEMIPFVKIAVSDKRLWSRPTKFIIHSTESAAKEAFEVLSLCPKFLVSRTPFNRM